MQFLQAAERTGRMVLCSTIDKRHGRGGTGPRLRDAVALRRGHGGLLLLPGRAAGAWVAVRGELVFSGAPATLMRVSGDAG